MFLQVLNYHDNSINTNSVEIRLERRRYKHKTGTQLMTLIADHAIGLELNDLLRRMLIFCYCIVYCYCPAFIWRPHVVGPLVTNAVVTTHCAWR